MLFREAIQKRLPQAMNGASEAMLGLLDYHEEVAIKARAFRDFLQANGIEASPEKVIESPKPRGYRTTTKRRVYADGASVRLAFAEVDEDSDDAATTLEPDEHAAVYRFIGEMLSRPAFSVLAQSLNWIIIRGSYRYRTVIFNVFRMDASVVRKLKIVAEHLQNECSAKVSAAHVYFDPKASDYYLEASRPTDALAFKQLYGPRELSLDLGDFRLKYPVTGFSQINESQVPNFLATASNLLQMPSGCRFFDLYCGYGLFTFGIGSKAKETIGVEWEGPSVEAAKASAKFLHRGNARFITGSIDADFIRDRLPEPSPLPEFVLLDPPRKGTAPGVIRELASRKPERVLHVFCGTDEIPRELYQWKSAGYVLRTLQPLDMFPGTPHLETFCLLEHK